MVRIGGCGRRFHPKDIIMETFIEYRVRPVTRFIVTRFEKVGGEHVAPNARNIGSVGSVGNGEFNNADTAYAVAYALARADHERLGYELGDPRIRYPDAPDIFTQGHQIAVSDGETE